MTAQKHSWRRIFGSALRTLRQHWGSTERESPQRSRRLAPLRELEERCLLSVTPVGPEYLVNTFTQGAQQTSPQTPKAVAANPANGNYVVVWSSQGQNGGGSFDVYLQRYNSAGVAQGPATLVDTPISGVNQQYANVAMNSSGNFVVTWSSQQGGHWNVYAQQYNASGVAQGAAILVDTPAGSDQEYSSVAMNSSGNFVVTWSGQQSGTWQVYANVFNASGVSQSGPMELTNAGISQIYPQVAMSDAGNFVITWIGNPYGISWNVYGELFGSNNQPVGSIFQVNNATTNDAYADVAMDAAGNFTIAWSGQQTGTWYTYAQSYFSSGAANGSVFQVGPANGLNQVNASIAFAGSADPIITWASQNQDGSGWGVFAQQYTPTGIAVGSEFQVNTYTTGDQEYPSIAGAANGAVAIVWTSQNQDGSGAGVYGQLYTSTATAGFQVNGVNLLVSEDNNVVEVNSLTGAVVATFPTGVPNAGATIGPDGSLYVTDYYNHQILHYDANGNFLASFGSAELSNPQGLAFGPDGNLYVADVDSTVQKFSPTGTYLGVFVSAGSGGLLNAKAIVWGPDGNAYVSSYYNSEVLRYNSTTGAFMDVFATGSGGFEGLTFGPDGNLYVASYGDNAIYRYSGADGTSMGAFASGAPLAGPFGLRFDAVGNLDVASQSSGVIQTFDGTTGAFLGNLATGLTDPGYMSSVLPLVTSETGTSASFTVALTSQPNATVTVNLATSVGDEGTLSQSSLTFDAGNWNTPQTVTVTGVDDHIVHGNQTYEITGVASSTDASYSGLVMTPVTVVNTEADVAGFTVTPTALTTSESGTSANFGVALTSAPIAPVTIQLAMSVPGEGSLSQASLTFDASNWNVVQTVTVTGLDDHIVHGDQTYQITGTATSADASYSGVAMTPVTVTNTEADVAGFTVTATSVQTSTAGGAASFSVVLTSEPLANVVVPVSSSDPAVGTPSVSSLTFSPADWKTPQTVTVTGVVSAVAGNDVGYTVQLGPAGSADPIYQGMVPPAVNITNLDLNRAGIQETPSSGRLTTDASGAGSFSLVLGSQPTGNVVIGLGSTGPGAGMLSATTLTFTPANWNAPQTVTLIGAASGSRFTIQAAASSADSLYNGLSAGLSVAAPAQPVAPVVAIPVAPVVAVPVAATAPVAPPIFPSGNSAAPAVLVRGQVSGSQAPSAAATTSAGLAENAPSQGHASPTGVAFAGGHSFTVAAAAENDTAGAVDAINARQWIFAAPIVPRTAGGQDAQAEGLGTSIAWDNLERDTTGDQFSILSASQWRLGRVESDLALAPPWRATEADGEGDSNAAIPTAMGAVAVTGLLASAGYVLLNTRAGIWALSLLTSRPLWNDLDPLEIVCAWDEAQDRQGDSGAGHQETLLSMVEEGPRHLGDEKANPSSTPRSER